MPYGAEEDKPCRACSDFKSWAKEQGKTTRSPTNTKTTSAPVDCPLDKADLGRSTWDFLHSMTAYYPKKPTREQKRDMNTFFEVFAKFYPCEECALDFQHDIKAHPPKTNSQDELMNWLCDRHNTINAKLGKPKFDCSKVFERWRDGWKDGSCD